MLDIWSSKLGVPSSKLGVSSLKLGVSSSKLGVPSLKADFKVHKYFGKYYTQLLDAILLEASRLVLEQ